MTEKEQLESINKQMTSCIKSIDRIEVLLIGDNFNKEGLIHKVEKINAKVDDMQYYQLQQKGGISVGKWIAGTTIGAYLLSQIEPLKDFIKHLFKV